MKHSTQNYTHSKRHTTQNEYKQSQLQLYKSILTKNKHVTVTVMNTCHEAFLSFNHSLLSYTSPHLTSLHSMIPPSLRLIYHFLEHFPKISLQERAPKKSAGSFRGVTSENLPYSFLASFPYFRK
jgi:hypothetical protein